MSNTDIKILTETDQRELFEELENRFGHEIATELVESIKQAASNQDTPDYMPVKACSEILETFRSEAQAILRLLKKGSSDWKPAMDGISYLEERKLEIEFRRTYRLYRISMGLFYPLYHRALADCARKMASAYGRPSETTPQALAA